MTIRRPEFNWKFDLDELGEALHSLIDEPRQALERIRQRLPMRRRLGLALSGGAQRGIAHVGVLSVLERERIAPDFVAGTSAGAAVGAIYCAGWSTGQMLQLLAGMNWRKLGDPQWRINRSLGFLDGARFEGFVRDMLGDLTFEDLEIPLTVVTADLVSGEEVHISRGPLAPAVRASCALPAIFTPVEYGDRLLVDGGIVNNLPTSVLIQQGADYTIAVNVSASTEPSHQPKHILDVLELTYRVMRRTACHTGPEADCLIMPEIGGTDILNISNDVSRLYQVGVDAAEEVLPQLKADLGLD